MKFSRLLLAAGLVLAFTGAIQAETKVEMKNVHLCCGACVKAVAATLSKVDGVTGMCDQKAKTVTITAKDDAAAKKAVAALAEAGFAGDTGNKDIASPAVADVPKGNVKSITLTGIHNCCGQCNNTIKKTVKSVKGVTEDTAAAKSDTFEVKGDFSAEDLVKALTAAGFQVKVKK